MWVYWLWSETSFSLKKSEVCTGLRRSEMSQIRVRVFGMGPESSSISSSMKRKPWSSEHQPWCV